MRVECIQNRPDGYEVLLGQTTYRFERDAEGRLVAEVGDAAHLQRFGEIAEGYRLLPDPALAPEPTPQETGEASERAALIREYVGVFGRRPAGQPSVDTLRRKLSDARGLITDGEDLV